MDETLVVKDLEPDSLESVTSSSQNNIPNVQSQSPHTHNSKRPLSSSQSSRSNSEDIAANCIEKGGNNFHYIKSSSKMGLNSPNCGGLSKENSRILKRSKSGAIVEDEYIGRKYLIANPGAFFRNRFFLLLFLLLLLIIITTILIIIIIITILILISSATEISCLER